jgi:WD40 repeat protein
MCVLNAHEAEVNAVAYSPFYDTLFASVSADRTAAVWDRRVMGGSSSGHSNKAATPVAVLDNGHVEQVFCVAWSPHHPTRLLTGINCLSVMSAYCFADLYFMFQVRLIGEFACGICRDWAPNQKTPRTRWSSCTADTLKRSTT